MGQIDRALRKLRTQDAKQRASSAASAAQAAAAAVQLTDPADKPEVDIASLPKVSPDRDTLRNNRIVLEDTTAPSAAYKILRTRILQRMRRNGWKTIAVTGTCPDEGKTLTAINLSFSMAQDVNTSIILVDLDLRRPSVYDYLGISPRAGISDHLIGDTPIQAVAVNPGIERLGLVLNDKPFGNSSEMLSSPKMRSLVKQLSSGSDRIVVFDLPPLLAADDMLAFHPLVDAVLVVTCQGKTKQEDLIKAKELLRDMNVVGTVLNQSSEDTAPYYYYAD